jgi:hypothetical protein
MPFDPAVEQLEIEASGPTDLDRGQPVLDPPTPTGQ